MNKGFGEEQSGFRSEPEADASDATRARLKVGPGGRVVIPAPMREALGVGEGDVLVATLDGGKLRLETMRSALTAARALVAEFVPPGVSLADELIEERRREQEREDRE